MNTPTFHQLCIENNFEHSLLPSQIKELAKFEGLRREIQRLSKLRGSAFDNLLNSIPFKKGLQILNKSLVKVLQQHNYPLRLIGNLFYDNAKLNFHQAPLVPAAAAKRERVSQVARMRSRMFEIGINGGHSSFLCLCSNPTLTIHANDKAEFYPPIGGCHPEVYVKVGCDTLNDLFPGRFSSFFGDCLEAVPSFVQNNPSLRFDMVHIDGNKNTYEQDFLNLSPLLTADAIIIFDDSNEPRVQKTVNNLLKRGLVHRLTEYPQLTARSPQRNEIVGVGSTYKAK